MLDMLWYVYQGLRTQNTKEIRAIRSAQKKLRKRMGLCRFYCCPFLRPFFDGTMAPPLTQKVNLATLCDACAVASLVSPVVYILFHPSCSNWTPGKRRRQKSQQRNGRPNWPWRTRIRLLGTSTRSARSISRRRRRRRAARRRRRATWQCTKKRFFESEMKEWKSGRIGGMNGKRLIWLKCR